MGIFERTCRFIIFIFYCYFSWDFTGTVRLGSAPKVVTEIAFLSLKSK